MRGISPRRGIQSNHRANHNYHTYVRKWDFQDSDPRTSQLVRSLQPGDVIQLFPRAYYQGWVNFIKEATIEIEFDDTKKSDVIQLSSRADNIALPLYKALDRNSSEIRLLVIHPGLQDDPVTCSLIHSSLVDEQNLQFEALSYCWGDQNEIATILLVDGAESSSDSPATPTNREIRVSASVRTALKHLRYDDGRTRVVWVDSLCINQLDLDERASQVGLMKQIYSQAESVTIWLGEADPSIHLVMDAIRDISNYFRRTCPGGSECVCTNGSHLVSLQEIIAKQHKQEFGVIGDIFQIHKTSAPEELQNQYGTSYELVLRLFEHVWFRRVWVLQEALNAQKAFLLCGYKNLPWDLLIEANNAFERPDSFGASFLEPQTTRTRMPSLWTKLAEMRHGEKLGLASTPKIKILDVFLEGLEFNATDPRDKLFALLGFGRETSDVERLPPIMQPNYGKPIDEVFADFTRWCIMEYNSLGVLSTVHGIPGRTWQSLHCQQREPDAVLAPTWIIRSVATPNGSSSTLGNLFEYTASGNTTPDLDLLRDHQDPLRLPLRGFRLTHIQKIGAFPFYENRQDITDLIAPYVNIFDPLGRMEAWTAYKHDMARVSDDISSHNNQAYWHGSTHWSLGSQQPLVSIGPATVKEPEDPEQSTSERALSPKVTREMYLTNGALPCHDRCFFMDSEGSLGLCPSAAREGDLIVVLYGGSVPYLLRAIVSESMHSNCYEFVGECFLQGRMDGSVVEERKRMSADPEIFVLV